MTDNEKRSHDLAIASIPFVFEELKAKYTQEKEINVRLDEIYFDLYNKYLSLMKEHFQESE